MCNLRRSGQSFPCLAVGYVQLIPVCRQTELDIYPKTLVYNCNLEFVGYNLLKLVVSVSKFCVIVKLWG